MKNLFLSLLLFIGIASTAQVVIQPDSITFGGVKFRTEAEFECMIWNNRTKTVTVQWRYKVLGFDSSIIAEKTIEQIADNNSYVYQDGTVVDSLVLFDSVLFRYRIAEMDLEDGTYKPTGAEVMREYDFYKIIAEYGAGGVTINHLIMSAGLKRKKIFKL